MMTKLLSLAMAPFIALFYFVHCSPAGDEVSLRAVGEGNNENSEIASQEISNAIGMKFRLIPAGTFQMGIDGRKPGHPVTITRSFYMGVHEVTQEQYERVMGINPSKFTGVKNPVDSVSWQDAVVFCDKLGEMTGEKYRLPTEAEWEYACRAGTTTKYYWGDNANIGGEYAWCEQNSGEKTHPVGLKKPNAWGLYDMSNNLWEWCSDWYAPHGTSAQTDPEGPPAGNERVLHGSSFDNPVCPSATRINLDPDSRHYNIGFRVVREAD